MSDIVDPDRTERRLRLGRARQQVDEDLEAELAYHFAEAVDALVAEGYTPEDASKEARRRFGDVDRYRHQLRSIDRRRVRMGTLKRRVDDGLRAFATASKGLRRSPAFAAAVVATLALGIGANTAIVSLVNRVLLAPTPHVRDAEELVQVFTSDFSGPAYGTSSYPDYLDFRSRIPALGSTLYTSPGSVSWATEAGEGRVLLGEFTSGNYFDVLGVPLALGRGFTADEDDPATGSAVAVLGHTFWTREFGGDPTVVGRTIPLSGTPVTVVGVAPAGFNGSLPIIHSDLWLPTSAQALLQGPGDFESRGARGALLRGRLRAGATVADAQAQADVLAAQLYEAYPNTWTDVREASRRITVVSDREARVPPQARGAVVGFMALLMAAVGGVLMIACANVANLMLARANRRAREVAVRAALGAGRRQLIAQLFAESAALATLGGVGGILLAHAGLRGLSRASLPLPVDITLDFGVDRMALLVSVAMTAGTALLIGSLPALRASRPDLVPTLKSGEGTQRRRHRRFGMRNLLVMSQVAGSLVLLVSAGLFLKGLRAAASVDPGLNAAGVAVASVNLDIQGYDAATGQILLDRLLERLRTTPGVIDAATTELVPLTGGGRRSGVGVPGYEPASGEDMEFDHASVSTRYFETLGVPLVAGRTFDETDGPDGEGALVVNEAFADRFWPGDDAVGKPLVYGGGDARVVGVVATGKYRALDEDPRPAFWAPARQSYGGSVTVLVKSEHDDPTDLIPTLRSHVRELDPQLPVGGARSLEAAMAVSLLPQRVASMVLALTGALAILLACLGLYGVLSYAVSRRTREVGVRMAVGARASDVVGMVVREGIGVAAAGALAGLAIAIVVTRLLQGFLFGVSPLDPLVFVGITAGLLVVAGTASYLPARTASRIHPAETLRND